MSIPGAESPATAGSSPEAMDAHSRGIAQMPALGRLFRAAATACAPILFGACLFRKFGFAIGVVYGLGTCAVLYAFLRSYVAYAVSVLVAPGSSLRRPGDTIAARAQFLAMFLGKFIVLGAVLYLLLAVLKGNIAGFLTGFAVSQIAITAVGYKHLDRLRSS